MEQTNDFKLELQQELQGLQQHVEQHSQFNSDVWRRSVKRYSSHLWWTNIVCCVLLVVIMTVCSVVLTVGDVWPWWMTAWADLAMAGVVVESLIASRGIRKADVQSRQGLLSLRESLHKATTYSARKQKIFRWSCWIFLIVTDVYLFFYQREIFFTILIASLIAFPVGRKTAKKVKNHYDELGEEIDELLKEE